MNEEILRPPLPAYASHEGIRFIVGNPPEPAIAAETLAAIGSALALVLPQGDFSVSSSGRFIFHQETHVSAWQHAAMLEGVTRSPR